MSVTYSLIAKSPFVDFHRHVALLEICGKEFQLQPIPLRTTRPFKLEEVILSESAEEEGFELTDQMAISKFLKSKVSALVM